MWHEPQGWCTPDTLLSPHDCRVITNVGTSHIGLLGSRGNIACAKAEIVEGMEAHGDIRPTLILESGGDFTSFVRRSSRVPKALTWYAWDLMQEISESSGR